MGERGLSVPRRILNMSAAFYACLLFWCLPTNTVEAELAPPKNLTMSTLNTNYTLCWDWDQSSESHAIQFTTQYVAKFKLKSKKKSPIWYTACEKTSRRSCDLTEFNLYFLGIYMLRVQASVSGRLSDWALKEFCPDKDAALGPPTKVELYPAGSDLDVFISDPLTSTNSSMKENHPELYYHILYWERSGGTQVSSTQTLTSSANMVTLPSLKAWTWYCVSVQSRYDFYNKSSSFTSPLCMQTQGAIPWWQIFGCFLLSLVICFLVMLLSICCSFWCYKKLKATFYPSVQLPTSFQYLCDSSGSDIPRLLTPDSDSELLCDKVTICPQSPVLEVHDPPLEVLPAPQAGLEPDSSVGFHSRQNSSGSRDSGVYSTGGNSSQQQPSCQSSTGAEDSGHPFDLEQVKMQDMAPGLKTQLLITDEGIVDMCV